MKESFSSDRNGKTIHMLHLCLFNIVRALSALKHTPVSSYGKLARTLKYFSAVFQTCLLLLYYYENICNVQKDTLHIKKKKSKICTPNEINISEIDKIHSVANNCRKKCYMPIISKYL